MSNEKVTVEQLDKLQANALAETKAWVKYAEDLNDYKAAVANDTIPPGQPPPTPPGTK
jgi:hypothetical protein